MFKFRNLILILTALCVLFGAASDAEAKKAKSKKTRKTYTAAAGVNDPRYAALIMNPNTGEIYHQHDADARRYPASLTKMMTLYLLFEALENGKVSLGDRMSVSALAARQPQTNLSLDEGDRIDVKTAIESLVVRSANDVSVVVAEHLGDSVENFAEMMTAKARALGMRSTVFQNPNGLPNAGQYTTARDMAKLGIALKRDFPRYYHYFSTLQFSHNGVTYYTHNRVMLRYAGVDGIKTGYIGASGFNLVSSVTRGGRPLVGVVMGGGTGAWRDNRMIQLLDQSYQTIASRGAARGKMYPTNLPLSKDGQKKAVGTAAELETAPSEMPMELAAAPELAESDDANEEIAANELPAELPPAAANSPFDAAHAPASSKATTAPRVVQPSRSRVIQVKDAPPAKAPFAIGESVPAPAAEKPPAEPVSLARGKAKQDDFNWGIQVGAFSTKALADQAVLAAQQTAAKQLVGAKAAVVGQGAGSTYRARIENVSQTQAKRACEALIASHSPCFIYKSVK